MMSSSDPEVGKTIVVAGILTNYQDAGEASDSNVMLLHGSGPGVSAWVNWRNTIPELAMSHRVIAPDMVGFGFSERPEKIAYGIDVWVDQAIGLLDELGIEQTALVGNSFGGALALKMAILYPERITKLVLMGSVGVSFKLTDGLDKVWGYEPSFESMKSLLDIFAFDRSLVTDELAELRYKASIRPGFQESFSAMFPAPRQRWVDAMASDPEEIKNLEQATLIVHGREDQVIPLQNSYLLHQLIKRSELHVFGQCGHWTQIEHAKRFNQLLVNFLE